MDASGEALAFLESLTESGFFGGLCGAGTWMAYVGGGMNGGCGAMTPVTVGAKGGRVG